MNLTDIVKTKEALSKFANKAPKRRKHVPFDKNVTLVLSYLIKREPMTRQDLARISGLGSGTIDRCTDVLISKLIVRSFFIRYGRKRVKYYERLF